MRQSLGVEFPHSSASESLRDDLQIAQPGAVIELDKRKSFRIATRANPALHQDGIIGALLFSASLIGVVEIMREDCRAVRWTTKRSMCHVVILSAAKNLAM